MKKNTIISVVVIIIIIVSAIFFVRSRKNEQPYNENQVVKTDIRKTINVDAQVKPDIYANISSELPALIDTVDVLINDHVTKGQVLFTLNKDSIKAQTENAKLAVERAELAEINARRKWDMLKPEERENVKKTTEQARQSLREVLAQAEKTTIVSPINGIVIRQDAQVGEVAKGIIMRIIDPTSLRLEALIPEVDFSKIIIGDEAFISLDAYPNKIVKGKLTSIDTSSTVDQNSTYYRAIVVLDDKKDAIILDGMNAEIDIEINKKTNVIAVSRDFTKKDENGYFVYVLDDKTSDDSQFVKKHFEVGLVGDDFVEVVSGLNVNDKIVMPQDK